VIPEKGDTIQNVEINPLLKAAFNFIPGQLIHWEVQDGKRNYHVKWEVRVTSYNQPYIYCHQTNSVAFLLNNGTMFYFLSFSGDRSSLLYLFYLGAYQVLLGYYPDIMIRDHLPVNTLKAGVLRVIQDFVAPFWQFLKVTYQLEYGEIDSAFNSRLMVLHSQVVISTGGVRQSKHAFELKLELDKISRFTVKSGRQKLVALQLNEFASNLI